MDNSYSIKSLAYLGDAVWSLVTRDELIKAGISDTKKLQAETIKRVSAKAQAKFYTFLNEEGYLLEEEKEIFKRGRNAHSGSIPKNTDAQTYRISTGFEALIGYLYVEKKEGRIREIWEKIRTL